MHEHTDFEAQIIIDEIRRVYIENGGCVSLAEALPDQNFVIYEHCIDSQLILFLRFLENDPGVISENLAKWSNYKNSPKSTKLVQKLLEKLISDATSRLDKCIEGDMITAWCRLINGKIIEILTNLLKINDSSYYVSATCSIRQVDYTSRVSI